MKNLTTRDEFDALASHLKATLDKSKLELIRNSFAAIAAFSLGLLVALTQVDVLPDSLKLAVLGGAIAAPLSLMLALVVELYLHLGESSYKDFNEVRTQKIYSSLQRLVIGATYLTTVSIVFYLWPWALIPFVCSTIIGIGYLLYCYARAAKWYASK
jgi:hypothetical protein